MSDREGSESATLVGGTSVGKSFLDCALALRPATKAIAAATAEPPGSSPSSPWPAPIAPTSTYSSGSPGSTSSCSTIGGLAAVQDLHLLPAPLPPDHDPRFGASTFDRSALGAKLAHLCITACGTGLPDAPPLPTLCQISAAF